MVLGKVEETVTEVEIDDETLEEIIKVCFLMDVRVVTKCVRGCAVLCVCE